DEDFEMDRKDKTIALTASGLSKAEKFFGIENITNKYIYLIIQTKNDKFF
ncbi:hypothetical protein I6C21_15275, partial [Clostridioides difficile]|nr:hypothetical protein [Clostridioides difficile]